MELSVQRHLDGYVSCYQPITVSIRSLSYGLDCLSNLHTADSMTNSEAPLSPNAMTTSAFQPDDIGLLGILRKDSLPNIDFNPYLFN